MQQYNKTKGIRGIVSIYNMALRFRDMITPKAQERARIFTFRQRYGDAAAKEAFKVSRPTLFRWQKKLKERGGKLEALNPKSAAPLSLTRVQTDNGSEFADHFEAYCGKENIVHFHSYPRTPKMQSEIERFNRTLSDAFISRNRELLAYDINTFNEKMMDWLFLDNTKKTPLSPGPIFSIRCNVA